ncbi:hypothetical protein PG988_000233 [Apiospora saccharicola]
MVITLVQQAEEIRQHGNMLYKKGKLTDGELELDKSNYLPLSNLSAAYFETGKYRESIDFANNALQILAEAPDSEPPKQKLLVRMMKGLLYLRDLDTVESIMERIEGNDERASLQLSFERMHAMREPHQASMEEWSLILRRLPKYKPQMVDEAEYFCVGHDVPESQVTGDLIRTIKPDETVSILFAGIGDARHMFQTILEFPVDPPRKLHFMVLDHKPAVVARNLIFFHLFNEAATEKDEEKAHLGFCILAYLFTVQYLAEYLLMHDRKLIESHFGVKLSSTTPEGYKKDTWPLIAFYKWERVAVPSKRMEHGELMPQASLMWWLCSHFLKICLPYRRDPAFHPDGLVFAPLNLTMFMRLLVHVSELGYPAHWLSALINNLLAGHLTTTARAPWRQVLKPQDIDKAYPPRTMSVEPWRVEFAALVSLWQPLLPFGLVTPSDLLTPADDIHEYTVKFPAFFHHESSHVPHFMLVFWNQQKMEKPPANIRSLLLDDEDGDTTNSAQFVRREVVRVVTTFNWSTDDRAATFWLRRSDMEEMVRKDWVLYVWRSDFWDKQSTGLSLKSAEVTSRHFMGTE